MEVGVGDVLGLKKKLKAFTAAWARLQHHTPGWPTDEQDKLVHQRLLEWLHFHEAMLVGELVPEALRFLTTNPEHDVQSFSHIIVDEYQDLNRAEQVLLDTMAAHSSLTVVGDEDQSIYSFKYANPEGIRTFDESHPGTCDKELEVCARCPKRVVSVATSLVSHNINRVAKTWTPSPSAVDGEIHIVQWPTMEDEAAGLSRFIKHRIDSGQVNAGKVLVLTQRRQFGYAIRDALVARGVSAHSFFQEEGLEGNPKEAGEHPAQTAFTLLTLLVNEEDRVALRCWCGFDSPSLHRGAWGRLRLYCEGNAISPIEALRQLAAGNFEISHGNSLKARITELDQELGTLSGLLGVPLLDALFPSENEAGLRTVPSDGSDSSVRRL